MILRWPPGCWESSTIRTVTTTVTTSSIYLSLTREPAMRSGGNIAAGSSGQRALCTSLAAPASSCEGWLPFLPGSAIGAETRLPNALGLPGFCWSQPACIKEVGARVREPRPQLWFSSLFHVQKNVGASHECENTCKDVVRETRKAVAARHDCGVVVAEENWKIPAFGADTADASSVKILSILSAAAERSSSLGSGPEGRVSRHDPADRLAPL